MQKSGDSAGWWYACAALGDSLFTLVLQILKDRLGECVRQEGVNYIDKCEQVSGLAWSAASERHAATSAVSKWSTAFSRQLQQRWLL
jgi:hypothetical protein